MQATSRTIRTLAAAAVVLVALALMGASWYAGRSTDAKPAMVGVPTGEYVNGIEVQRLPSITVTARRSDVEAAGGRD
jgi:hypothetical protein